jgi:H+/Cl- antiporter ClcA
MLPLLIVVVIATVVARTLDPRSIYDARLTDKEVKKQLQERRPAPT